MMKDERSIRPGRRAPAVVSPLSFNEALEAKRVEKFIKDTVDGARSKGVVLGLSGGVDSSVACTLCVRSIGKDNVLGVLMPSPSTPHQDMIDARDLARTLGIRTKRIPVNDVVKSLLSAAGRRGGRIPRANLQARTRMMILYYYSNSLGRLVAGTGDRSEILIGFFTKWGDGGVDFLPIGHLYKTQVRMLAKYLGLPERIAMKPASPQLWKGHAAIDEIPADYDRLDLALHYVFDKGLEPRQAALRARLSLAEVKRMIEMNSLSAHKRALPTSIGPPPSTRNHRYGYT